MNNKTKAIRFLGSVTASTGGTISTAGATGNDLVEMVSGYQKMDILVNVNTLAGGTSPSLALSIQELFSDVGYVETGAATSTATGQSFVYHDNSNYAMGLGEAKKVVITPSGSPTGVDIDVYGIFSQP